MPDLVIPRADFFESARLLQDRPAEFHERYHPFSSLTGSYAGLLQWQDHFRYVLAERRGAYFPLAYYGNNVYLPLPPRPFSESTLEDAFRYLDLVNGPRAVGISRVEGLTEEEKELAASWGWPPRPTLAEYVYDRALVAGLHGDPYRAKRAEVNHLLKHQAVSFRAYRPEDEAPCLSLFGRWSQARSERFKGENAERMLIHAADAHRRILKEGAGWGIRGWVTEVDGAIAGYTFGAPLSPEVFGVYVEVTDLTVKGLSAYIFSRLCRFLEGIPFLNAGDAEELPGLAEAKKHWHPIRKLKLYAADRRP